MRWAGKVKAAGGSIYRPAAEHSQHWPLRTSSGDPHGAAFIIFKGSADMAPTHDPSKSEHFGWRERHAGDREADFAFYSGLFGWTKGEAFDMGPMGLYQLFNIDGAMAVAA